MLQAFHYFTEYLVAHDYFSAADAARLQSAAAGLYKITRGAVDPCDAGYWICPTYEALIAAQASAAAPDSISAPKSTPSPGSA